MGAEGDAFMKFKLSAGAAIVAILTGCGGNSDTPEACRYAVTTAIDRGDYDTALANIDSASCQGAYTADERNLFLGAIYVGKAGYSVPTIVNDIINVDQSSADSYRILSRVSPSRCRAPACRT